MLELFVNQGLRADSSCHHITAQMPEIIAFYDLVVTYMTAKLSVEKAVFIS